jgi:predicted permease
MVAGNFFQTLGVQPALGRLFVNEECVKGGRKAVLLSDAFWLREFAANPAILGKSITLNKVSVTVVGVLPPRFDFGSVFAPGLRIDVFVPAVMDDMRNWGNTLALVGRLKPGVPVSRAQAEADLLFPQLRLAHKDWELDYASTIIPLGDFVSGKLRRSLLVLWCAVGLILLIVCVNLSSLLLARAVSRSKEFALRTALGAGRMRLVRQLATESLVLAVSGAALGLTVAYLITAWLANQGSIALPLLSSVTVDGAALLWTLAITGAITVVLGLVPALRLADGDIPEALKDGGRSMSAGRRHETLRASLVVSEVALACVLLVGAGLLLRSFLKVLDIDPGFEASRAAAIRVDYDDGGKAERRGPVLQEMLRRISALPGVEAAGVADMLPLGRNRAWGFTIKGKSYPKGGIGADIALVRIVTPGYLAAMGMRLREGRDFTWRDGTRDPQVMILNQAAVREFWPAGENPLGRLVNRDGDTKVVGIISDVRGNSLEAAAEPEMYLPVTQADPEGAELVIRSKLPPSALASDVMKTLRSMNPAQPASELRPLQQIVDQAVSPRRFFVLLVCSFATLGLILASLGIYGVISYSVNRQTQEIGIRMALGAAASQVQRGVVAGALRLAFTGIALGVVASFVAAKWIASLLFATEPTDPYTFGAIVALLSVVAAVAGYVPARRASRIDPMVALRSE